jgi:hypothetical protein
MGLMVNFQLKMFEMALKYGIRRSAVVPRLQLPIVDDRAAYQISRMM